MGTFPRSKKNASPVKILRPDKRYDTQLLYFGMGETFMKGCQMHLEISGFTFFLPLFGNIIVCIYNTVINGLHVFMMWNNT